MTLNTGFWTANMLGSVARMNYCLLAWGPNADMPAAGNDGRLVLDTDNNVLYYDNGTSLTPLSTDPSGTIKIWSGAISAIPDGWVLCDGVASTYDLTDKFVIHADADTGGTNNVGDLGGENSHILTTAEMPSHSHTLSTNSYSGTSAWQYPDGSTATASESTSATGGGAAHENRPNYIALAYIEKT